MDNRIFYHLGLVSGFCSANDAPESVLDSIKKIEAAMLRLPVADKLDEILEILRGKPARTMAPIRLTPQPPDDSGELQDALDEAGEAGKVAAGLTDEEKVAQYLENTAPKKKERKPSNMSPLNRLRAGWRLKRGQAYAAYVKESEANGETPDEKDVWMAEYEEKFPQPTSIEGDDSATDMDVGNKDEPEEEDEAEAPSPKKEPFREVPADRLIERHNEFIGDREDGQVDDSDWKDIQSMMFGGGMSSEQCRKKYGVQPAVWDAYVKRMEAKDERKN